MAERTVSVRGRALYWRRDDLWRSRTVVGTGLPLHLPRRSLYRDEASFVRLSADVTCHVEPGRHSIVWWLRVWEPWLYDGPFRFRSTIETDGRAAELLCCSQLGGARGPWFAVTAGVFHVDQPGTAHLDLTMEETCSIETKGGLEILGVQVMRDSAGRVEVHGQA